MVETITPVVHGGRTGRWWASVTLHVVGAGASSALLGALLGGLGALVGASGGAAGHALVAAFAMVYLASELGARVPIPQLRRQVPEWWRSFFPRGPAAFLYGVGLGLGFLTYLGHGTLVVVSAAALTAGRPLVGAALLAPFGVVRGLTALVATATRTPKDGAALVQRLDRSAIWVGWRVAHGVSLAAVTLTAAWALPDAGARDVGAVAAIVLVAAFGFAGISKLAGVRTWRRVVASQGFPSWIERAAIVAVPQIELGIAALPLLGFGGTAGLLALLVVTGFSGVVLVQRARLGRRFACGCFGSELARDYRVVLVRNALLAGAGILAWRKAHDTSLVAAVRAPGAAELVPAAFVLFGLVLAAVVLVRVTSHLRAAGPRA